MTAMKDMECIGTRAFYRPVVECTFEQAVEMTAAAIRTARELGLSDMVVNTAGITGFGPPNVFMRYQMAARLVQSAGNALRLAIVARPEFFDPQNIAMLMMQNRGTASEAFTNELDALKWLDSRLGAAQRTPGFLNRAQPKD